VRADQGTVVSVVDGDTVDLASGVRVLTCSSTRPSEPYDGHGLRLFWREARALNTLLVLNQEVNLEYDVECRIASNRHLA